MKNYLTYIPKARYRESEEKNWSHMKSDYFSRSQIL
jgi:hypothetical protein